MTTEEFNKYMPRLGAYLYECNAVEAVNNQKNLADLYELLEAESGDK